MSTPSEIRASMGQNIADVMESGPRLSWKRNVVALAHDPERNMVLRGGLGAMGVGQMWCEATAVDDLDGVPRVYRRAFDRDGNAVEPHPIFDHGMVEIIYGETLQDHIAYRLNQMAGGLW